MPAPFVLNWLHDSVIGIEVWQFIGLGVMAVIIVAARFLIVWGITALIRRRTQPHRHEFWDYELKRLQRPLLFMLAAITLAIGFPILDFDADVENVVGILTSFAATLGGVLVGFRLVDAGADYWQEIANETDSKLDDQLVPLARTAGKLFVGAIGGVFILQNLDVNITSLIAGLGLGGLAVALAAQDTLKNLLGGATSLADKPFQVGDWVIVSDIEGTVEQVGFRSTRIRTFADSLITAAQRAHDRHRGQQYGTAHLAPLLHDGRHRLSHGSRPHPGVRRGHPRDRPLQSADAARLLHRRAAQLRLVLAQHHGLHVHRRIQLETRSCARATCSISTSSVSLTSFRSSSRSPRRLCTSPVRSTARRRCPSFEIATIWAKPWTTSLQTAGPVNAVTIRSRRATTTASVALKQ